MRRLEEYYSQNLEQLKELWEQTKDIKTVADLDRFLGTLPMTYWDVCKLIRQAISYFSESKMTPEGKRDGKKIQEHLNNGFGARLTQRTKISMKLIVALEIWIFGNSPIPLSKQVSRRRPIHIVRNNRYPHGYAIDILSLLDEHLRE